MLDDGEVADPSNHSAQGQAGCRHVEMSRNVHVHEAHRNDAGDDPARVPAEDRIVPRRAHRIPEGVAILEHVGRYGEQTGPDDRCNQRHGEHVDHLVRVVPTPPHFPQHEEGAGDKPEPGEEAVQRERQRPQLEDGNRRIGECSEHAGSLEQPAPLSP